MEARQTSLIRLLNGDKKFKIPVYQRSYSWRQSNCEQLLKDLRDVYTFNYNSHFFGSIVFLEENDGENSIYTIIDGQQRVTTVCLLLLAIRNFILNENIIDKIDINPEKITENYLTNKFSNEEKKLKLKLVEGDDATYEDLVLNKKVDKHNGLAVNYKYFYNIIKSSSLTDIKKLYDAIQKLNIVSVSLKLNDGDNPQLIFESLNSTGEELEEADKIRNYVLMGLSDREQDGIYKEYWEVIENTVGKEDLNKFIRYYLAIKLRNLSNEKNLYVDFKRMNHENKDIRKLLKDMLEFANYYRDIKKYEYKDNGYKGSIGRLMYLDLNTVIPLLFDILAARNKNLLDDNDLDEALSIIESYFVRRAICNLPTSSLNKTFVSIGAEIDNYMDKEQLTYLEALKQTIYTRSGKTRWPNNTEFKNNFMYFELYNAKSEFRKYILERLENSNSRERVDVETQINNKELTIEHIMPRKLTPEWKQMLGNNCDAIYTKYINTIGNLTLTAYNSEYSNYSFKEKKELKDKGFNYSKLFLNTYVKNQTKWQEKEMEDRANLLSDCALNIWKKFEFDLSNVEKEQWVNIDDDYDFTNKVITKFSFEGQEYSAESISDVYKQINKLLYNKDPELYVASGKNKVADNPEKLIAPYEVATGVYVERNFSSQDKISFLFNMIKKYGIEPENVSFFVEDKDFPTQDSDEIEKSKPLNENKNDIKVGPLAYKLISELLNNNRISYEEIIKLTEKEYSRATFSSIVYPVLAFSRDANMGNSKHYRYYKTPVKVGEKEYYISSQWYEDCRKDLVDWYEKHK